MQEMALLMTLCYLVSSVLCAMQSELTKPIPRMVHQIWLGSAMSPIKRAFTSTVSEHAKAASWSYHLWTAANLTRHHFPHFLPLIDKLRSRNSPHAMVADLMRYEIILHYGGLYLDTNIELLDRWPKASVFHILADAHHHNISFVGCNEDDDPPPPSPPHPYLAMGMFAAVSNHSLLAFLTSAWGHQFVHDRLNQGGGANEVTGPWFLGSARKHFFDSGRHPQADSVLASIHMLPHKAFYPYKPWKTDYVVTDKCWNNGTGIPLRSTSQLIRHKNFFYEVPCPASQYPDSLGVDHFCAGGGSWFKGGSGRCRRAAPIRDGAKPRHLVEGFVQISARAACEANKNGIERNAYDAGMVSLDACKAACAVTRERL